MTKLLVITFFLLVWAGSSLSVYKQMEDGGLWKENYGISQTAGAILLGPLSIGIFLTNGFETLSYK